MISLMRRTDAVVLLGLAVLAVSAVSVSIAVLRRGKFYESLRPESRPRRWVLASLLFLFAVFVLWFPLWMIWPNAPISRVFTVLFGLAFFIVGMTFKWLAPLVDWFIKRRGWPVR